MTSWTDLVVDATPIRAIYGTKVPSLNRATLHEICLHRDGPRAVLRFDLNEFPEHPPKKWQAHGANVVQLQLMFVGILVAKIHGWDTNLLVDITLTREGEMIRGRVDAEAVQVDLGAESVIVSKISAFQHAEGPTQGPGRH